MNKQRGYLNLNLGGFFAFLLCAGVAIGIGIAFVAPWAWGLIKPLIHALTA